MQERNHVEEHKLLPCLTKLANACSSLIEKQIKIEMKETSNKVMNSCCNRSSMSTHSEDAVVCK